MRYDVSASVVRVDARLKIANLRSSVPLIVFWLLQGVELLPGVEPLPGVELLLGVWPLQGV